MAERGATSFLEQSWRGLLLLVRSKGCSSREKRFRAALQLGKELEKALTGDDEATALPARRTLRLLCAVCIGDDWDVRIAASKALARAFETWEESQKLLDEVQKRVKLLQFADVDLKAAMKASTPLLKRRRGEVKDFAETQTDLAAARKEALKTLRLSSFDPNCPEGLANNDFAGIEDEDLEMEPLDLRSSLSGSKKRSRRELVQLQLRQDEKVKVADRGKVDLEELVGNEMFEKVKSHDETFAAIWIVLVQSLLSERWEARHGASCALLLLLSNQSLHQNTKFLTDIIVRCLYVLGMDLFGDYASNNVVAPVRESCAQLLASALLKGTSETGIQFLERMVEEKTFSEKMLASTIWNRRYASLLAMKYYLRVSHRNGMIQLACLVLFDESLCDDNVVVDSPVNNDDIRRAAADVILAGMERHSSMAEKLDAFQNASGRNLDESCLTLWTIYDNLDEISVASSESMCRLGCILWQGCSRETREAANVLDLLGSRLSHSNKEVRVSAIHALNMFLAECENPSSENISFWFEIVLEIILNDEANLPLWKNLTLKFSDFVDTETWSRLCKRCLTFKTHEVPLVVLRSLRFSRADCEQVRDQMQVLRALRGLMFSKSDLIEVLKKRWKEVEDAEEAFIARNAMENSCKILLSRFPRNVRSKPFQNAQLMHFRNVDVAEDLVTRQVCQWTKSMPVPASRKEAREWNEETSNAHAHARSCIDQVKKVLEKYRNLFVAFVEMASTDLKSGMNEVGLLLRTMMRCIEDHHDVSLGLAEVIPALLSHGKDKALQIVSGKLITKVEWESVQYVLQLLPKDLRLFPALCDPLRKPNALLAAISFVEGNGRHFLKSCEDLMVHFHELSGLGDEFVALCNAVCQVQGLEIEFWHLVHSKLLPFISDTDQSEELRARGLFVLEQMIEEDCNLPFSATLFRDLMLLQQDASSTVVQSAASRCFSKAVRLGPIEGQAPMPSSEAKEARNFILRKRNEGQKFLQNLLRGVRAEDEEALVAENGIQFREYQTEGIRWLAFLSKNNLGGVLADDLGLGKTLMTLTNLKRRAQEEPSMKHSLIICPASLTGHWCAEVSKFFESSLLPIACVGPVEVRLKALQQEATDKHVIFVTSFSTLARDVEEVLKMRFLFIVLDEAHTIRNPHTLKAEACWRIGSLGRHRLALTGTPIHNDVTDLWSIFQFLMPGYLGSMEEFENYIAKPIRASRNSTELSSAAGRALEDLHQRVLPFMLRRTKEVVLKELPEKIVQDILVALEPRQRDLYEKIAEKKLSLAVMTQLIMICTHPILCLRALLDASKGNRLEKRLLEARLSREVAEGLKASGKLKALDEILKNNSDKKVVVFSQYGKTLDLVEELLEGNHYFRLDAKKPHERQIVVNKFTEREKGGVLLSTTKAGGQGLNLTAAEVVVFLEHDWNPMNDLQAMDRAHRIGQKKVVNVLRLVCSNTIEERVFQVQKFKEKITDKIVNETVGTSEDDSILERLVREADENSQPEHDEDEEAAKQYNQDLFNIVKSIVQL